VSAGGRGIAPEERDLIRQADIAGATDFRGPCPGCNRDYDGNFTAVDETAHIIPVNNPLQRIMKEIRRVVELFQTVSLVSTLRQLDYGTSPERRGRPNAT
jgi:hypothetical protein